jgi:hypothetical protein
MKENMVERHPMKSYLKPEEVADMAALLPQKKAKSICVKFFEMDCLSVQNIIKINR